jgi:cyclophilin family peptidyl-prolyl cis-trans isomerase
LVSSRVKPQWQIALGVTLILAILSVLTWLLVSWVGNSSNERPARDAISEPAAPDNAPRGFRRPPRPAADVRPPEVEDLADYLAAIPGSGELTALIETSVGTIHCKLYPDVAPLAVTNFVGLATGQKAWLDEDGVVQRGVPFYDGRAFETAIRDRMVKGGNAKGAGYEFAAEIHGDFGLPRGTLAMVNSGRDTHTSEFMIANDNLNEASVGRHTVFGLCTPNAALTRVAKGSFDDLTMRVRIVRR